MAQKESELESISVTSRDPEPRKDNNQSAKESANKSNPERDDKKGELSEEDEQLKSELELLVERLSLIHI